MHRFLRVVLLGYWSPARFAEAVRDVPTPGWGLLAVLIRAAMDSVFTYLPPALMGWQPWPAPTITLLHAETYYWFLVWFTPFYMLFLWVYLAGVTHVVLRLTGRRTDMDFVLNVGGFAQLIVGAVLVAWDWGCYALGMRSPVTLGITHLILAQWATVLIVVAYRKFLDLPVWYTIGLYVFTAAASYPIVMLVMRSPFH
jgi:hypothetical protein